MIINGKEIALKIKDQLKNDVETIRKNYSRMPKLVVILIGDNPASLTYVRNKERGCDYIGIESEIIKHDSSFSERQLLDSIYICFSKHFMSIFDSFYISVTNYRNL